ncbi:terminase [Microvirga tunisiensis]|uniref:Terminase n=1 Tax=Microvirga tunisiensis TaxID=2108360 RepID=A0A5N7N8C8_9HYPH|nr:terminase [Microvirga tunisiensis]MPR13321.1 terminase [Microvirga tunisiensis]MPR31196.1 terminase [Microvirga tunisiensis]
MPAGRPTKYDEAYHPEYAYKFALLGMTDEEMAGAFRICTQTFYTWQDEHPAFLEALQLGKEPADGNMVMSFYKRGTGFWTESEKIFYDKDEINREERVVRVPTRVYHPPDAGAALSWLKNRQPDRWRDRKEITHDPGPVTQAALEQGKPWAQVFINGKPLGEDDGSGAT